MASSTDLIPAVEPEDSAPAQPQRNDRPPRSAVTTGGVVAAAVLAFTVWPLWELVRLSVSAGSGTAAQGFSATQYETFFTSSQYLSTFFTTLEIGVICTALTIVLGYPAALYIYLSQGVLRRILTIVAIAPLFIAVVIRTYGWTILLGTGSPLGLNIDFTNAAVVVGLVQVLMPFMIFSLTANLSTVDRELLTASRSLGASAWRTFRTILLPLSLPGLATGAMIVFTLSVTAVIVPLILGGNQAQTLVYLIYQSLLSTSDWPLGSAVGVITLALTAVGVAIIFGLFRSRSRKARA